MNKYRCNQCRNLNYAFWILHSDIYNIFMNIFSFILKTVPFPTFLKGPKRFFPHVKSATRDYWSYLHLLMFPQNEIILEEFYNISWYRRSVRFRNILLTEMILNQNRIEIKAFGMFNMNLKLFMGALRIIYSLLNILVLSTNK